MFHFCAITMSPLGPEVKHSCEAEENRTQTRIIVGHDHDSKSAESCFVGQKLAGNCVVEILVVLLESDSLII